ncbi:hypothetical protein L0Y59_01720 [Candidatus Uhrbacteria bacterium]|nr:hypothetical protein [Candidatus Uhrbacteria bacterium]
MTTKKALKKTKRRTSRTGRTLKSHVRDPKRPDDAVPTDDVMPRTKNPRLYLADRPVVNRGRKSILDYVENLEFDPDFVTPP